MSVIDYLREDGNGSHAQWHVPDLVPSNTSDLEVVLVFESPHVKELEAGAPVVGPSGRGALRYLTQDPAATESLGHFVRRGITHGEDRLAILNVSNVPMQAAAFTAMDGPDLSQEEWALVERVRRSTSQSVQSMRRQEDRSAGQALVDRLRDRIRELHLSSECLVVSAGGFARRMTGSVPDIGGVHLRVPHPSYGQWNRVANQDHPDLVRLRESFQWR